MSYRCNFNSPRASRCICNESVSNIYKIGTWLHSIFFIPNAVTLSNPTARYHLFIVLYVPLTLSLWGYFPNWSASWPNYRQIHSWMGPLPLFFSQSLPAPGVCLCSRNVNCVDDSLCPLTYYKISEQFSNFFSWFCQGVFKNHGFEVRGGIVLSIGVRGAAPWGATRLDKRTKWWPKSALRPLTPHKSRPAPPFVFYMADLLLYNPRASPRRQNAYFFGFWEWMCALGVFSVTKCICFGLTFECRRFFVKH
jgi:hypothetical protein